MLPAHSLAGWERVISSVLGVAFPIASIVTFSNFTIVDCRLHSNHTIVCVYLGYSICILFAKAQGKLWYHLVIVDGGSVVVAYMYVYAQTDTHPYVSATPGWL